MCHDGNVSVCKSGSPERKHKGRRPCVKVICEGTEQGNEGNPEGSLSKGCGCFSGGGQ